jgi:hypothetical protein
MADLLPTHEVPCAWPAPAIDGWCCYLGVLLLVLSAASAAGGSRVPWPHFGDGAKTEAPPLLCPLQSGRHWHLL